MFSTVIYRRGQEVSLIFWVLTHIDPIPLRGLPLNQRKSADSICSSEMFGNAGNGFSLFPSDSEASAAMLIYAIETGCTDLNRIFAVDLKEAQQIFKYI